MNRQQSQAAYAAYHSSSQGATGIARTILLYDQVTARLVDSRGKWEAGVFDGAFQAVKEAAAIVAMLSATLDESRGDRLCKTLRRYYTGLSFQILAVPRQKDPLARIDSLLGQVKEVRDAWAQVLAGGGQAGTVPEQQPVTRTQKDAIGTSLA